ncbi:MAG TPA: HEAT repeat domain-containing protein [Pyrinomonadaceae bacterium]|nr:HEAT repeat domain-containing protein [Pyrinomonadaceae bacterium]
MQEILGGLETWTIDSSRQHYLIIGPRGIGKTCLLALIQHRVRQSGRLNRKVIPVSVAEDSYGIATVSDLLIEVVRILGEIENDQQMQEVYERLRFDDDEQRVVDLSLDALRQFQKKNQCGILLMIENLNRLLEKQIRQKPQIHLLRKIFIEEEWLLAICTSPTYLNAVTQPEEPLFEFFRVSLLAEFTYSEQEEMLRKKAKLQGNVAFNEYLDKFHSRLRALYHFTGGNPRLTAMLYDLVGNQSITNVAIELDLLLDQLTPFYQDRMKDIPEQEGKLLETMALLPEGCSPTRLAKESRLRPKIVRALLTRLERSGYVRREVRRRKQTVYIIPERFFRIWHQMNHSRAARGRIQYLLEFFAHWYATKYERSQVWKELTGQFESGLHKGDDDRIDDISEYMRFVVDVSKGGERIEREFDRLRQTTRLAARRDIDKDLSALDRKYSNEKEYFLHKGYFLAETLGWHDRAVQAFQTALNLKKNDLLASFNLAVALEKLGNTEQALAAYKRTATFLARRRGKKGVREAQQVLLQILREDSNPNMTRVAGYVLGRTGKNDLAGDLTMLLRTAEESWRRRHCATALGLMGSKAAVGTLIGVVENDPAPDVRGAAATALGRIRSEEAIQPLIALLQDRDDITSASAATALGRIGSNKAVEPLLTLLADREVTVRRSAAIALARIIGWKKSKRALERRLSLGDDDSRVFAATALGYSGSRRAIPHLIELLHDGEGYIRADAALALGFVGDMEESEILIEALSDRDPHVRANSAFALGRIGSPAAVVPLIHVLKDSNPNVRSNAALALGSLNALEAVKPLIRLLNSVNARVRESAAVALGKIPTPSTGTFLLRALCDQVHSVRTKAAIALGQLQFTEAIPELIKCLADEYNDVRASAAAALGELQSKEAVPALAFCLANDKTVLVRSSAAAALGAVGGPQAVRALLKSINDKARLVREGVVLALLRVASEHPLPQLLELRTILLGIIANRPPWNGISLGENFVKAAFKTANVDIISEVLELVQSLFRDNPLLWTPYVIALEYLRSKRDPSVLEKQHLEMREAVQLLVSVFDSDSRASEAA